MVFLAAGAGGRGSVVLTAARACDDGAAINNFMEAPTPALSLLSPHALHSVLPFPHHSLSCVPSACSPCGAPRTATLASVPHRLAALPSDLYLAPFCPHPSLCFSLFPLVVLETVLLLHSWFES